MFEEKSSKHNCGFLCGLILDETGRYGTAFKDRHAAVSNGISSNAVLNQVWKIHGCLPHDSQGYSEGQVLFSQGFEKSGYTLQEYLDRFRCLYWQHINTLRWYWDGKHNEDLIVPIQYSDSPEKWEFEEYRPTTTPTEAAMYRNPKIVEFDSSRLRSFQINSAKAHVESQAKEAARRERAAAITLARRRAGR
jgi:hypothetical protein